MTSSQELGDSDRAVLSTPIYEAAHGEASERPTTSRRFNRIVAGAIAGAAVWMLLDRIGLPHVFGIGSEAGLLPLMLLGAIASSTRIRWMMPAIAVLLIILIAVVSYTPVIDDYARSFIRSDPVPQSADAVVVLSAGVTADGYLTQQAMDRALKGLELVKHAKAPAIVFTLEEKGSGARRYNSMADQKRISALAGISNVMFTRRVKSTHDEAVAVWEIARARGWRRIILVTSPFHSRRACATFEKVGLAVSCVPSESRDISVRRLVYPHDRIGAFSMWLYETAGTLRYRQLGWI